MNFETWIILIWYIPRFNFRLYSVLYAHKFHLTTAAADIAIRIFNSKIEKANSSQKSWILCWVGSPKIEIV